MGHPSFLSLDESTSHHLLRCQRSMSMPRVAASSISIKKRALVVSLLLCFVLLVVGAAAARTFFSNILSDLSTLRDNDPYNSKSSSSGVGANFDSFLANRKNCQIIYILGVEGSVHHGFEPVVEKLARRQQSSSSSSSSPGGGGIDIDVTYSHGHFRGALFGFHKVDRPLDDENLRRFTMSRMCPQDGKKHVIIEDASFPSGSIDDPRTYRIHRQKRWGHSQTMEEIAMSHTALNHPTNLNLFYDVYSPYADIKFVVLHRPYVETIASHYDLDGTPEEHSVVIGGFLMLLRRFLDSHEIDRYSGERLWTFVCVERLMSKFYDQGGDGDGGGNGNGNDAEERSIEHARRNIVEYLADFLGWDVKDCPECFDHWKMSKKNHVEVLEREMGIENVGILSEHMNKLEGTWPPPMAENSPPEQRCGL